MCFMTMQTFTTLNELSQIDSNNGSAVTIGTFDGVHRGHAALIEVLKREANARALPATVVTFQDMPYFHFKPQESARLLTLPAEKASGFAALGIDRLALLPFDASIAELTAEEFVRDVLIGSLGMRLLVIGPDFALGKGRSGNVAALQALGGQYGYETLVLEAKIADEDTPISSTRIRECLERGDARSATRLLGHAFALEGEVISGQQLGRTIGVPTINMRVHERKVLPVNGVYAARAYFDDGAGSFSPQAHPSALNIGTRPTVDDSARQSIEFHVIGEDIPVPPKQVRLEIVERLRDEEKFDGLDALVVQMKKDIAKAAEILNADR